MEVGVEVAGGGNSERHSSLIPRSPAPEMSRTTEARLRAVLTGVHTWSGPIGIFVCYGEEWPRQAAVGQAHNRIVDSYLDMNQLVACDPTMLVISDSYFLAGGHITLRAMPQKHEIRGLSVHGNTFRPAAGRGGPTIVLDQTRANFSRVIDMSVAGSVYGIDGPPWDPNTTISTPSVTRSMRKVRPDQRALRPARLARASRDARMRWLAQENAKEWLFDLSDVLLFPRLPIRNVQYSIEIESEDAFARHASRPPQGMVRPLCWSRSCSASGSGVVRPLGAGAGGEGRDGRGGDGDGHDHRGPVTAQRGVLAEQDLPVPVGRGLPLLLASGRGVPCARSPAEMERAFVQRVALGQPRFSYGSWPYRPTRPRRQVQRVQPV